MDFSTTFILLIFVGLYYLYKKGKKQIQKEEGRKVAAFMQQNQKWENEEKARQYGIPNNPFTERTAEIVYQSLHTAINSKNIDTIESRIQVAQDKFNDLQEKDELFADNIVHEFEKLLERAYTAKYTNIAQAYFDKSQTLKTEKSKQKYYKMAKEHLELGFEDHKANYGAVKRKYIELFQPASTNIVLTESKDVSIVASDTYPKETPIEMIQMYESGMFEELKHYITQKSYAYAGTPESNKLKEIAMFFVKHDPLYIDILTKVKSIVSKNEDVKQSTIYKEISPDGFYDVDDMRYVLYYADEYKDIVREKFGNSYKLYTKKNEQ